MFHCYYTCDACQRVLDPKDEIRYVVRISPTIDLEDVGDPINDDRDYLDEINDQLESPTDGGDAPLEGDADEPVEYDLCSECRQKFSLESAGNRVIQSWGFSEN
jgi:hypothetical protein